MSGRLRSDGMPPEPLPDPESEQLAALLGDGTARLVYGLLYRRRLSPPTAAEIGLFLSAAASASMPADRVIRSLCEDCLKGKRQYQQTYASYSEQIGHAADFDEPQRRIDELLLALRGEWVPSELIGIVASAKEYQTDYEKRRRAAAAGPQRERGLPAQTARSRPGSPVPRAALIAVRILAPTSRATGGGKALPTCRYEAVFRP
jgi:hypothetical protein